VLILAGCAGGGGGNSQRVTGAGYSFSAPGAWTVTHAAGPVAASSGPVDRVQVEVFRLVRAYRGELLVAASRELDRVAHRLAAGLGGRVASRVAARVAGHDARSYRIVYGKRVDEITFVLDDRREYELLCRRSLEESDAFCRMLVESFELR
jgi:hypothetical protein